MIEKRKFSSVSLPSTTMQELTKIGENELIPLGQNPSAANIISFLVAYYRKNNGS